MQESGQAWVASIVMISWMVNFYKPVGAVSCSKIKNVLQSPVSDIRKLLQSHVLDPIFLLIVHIKLAYDIHHRIHRGGYYTGTPCQIRLNYDPQKCQFCCQQ